MLGVHFGSIDLINGPLPPVGGDLQARRRSGLVLEINEFRPQKNEEEDDGHHYVVVKTAALVGPENVTFDGAPNAGHSAQPSLNFEPEQCNQGLTVISKT